MGQPDTASTSAARLRLLQEEMSEPRRSVEPGMPRAAAVFPPAPVNLGLLAHIQQSVTELVHETRAAAPDAGPAPAEAAAVYAWMTAHTAHLDDGRAQYRQAVVYRQGLEHALLAGDETVIRRESCLRCGCWGLVWRKALQHAACVHPRCTDAQGRGSVWTLAQLAERAVRQAPAAQAT